MQSTISFQDIMAMDKQERVHFANSLGGFKSVCLIGTQNKESQTNLAIIDSLVHIGSNPPLFAMIFRPGVVARHTLENILETKCYTINHINEFIYKQAHQTSARYDRTISEFEITGLTAEYKNEYFAPFVKQSQLQVAMEFKEKIDLKINNTVMIIGEVKEVYLPTDCLQKDGFIDLEKSLTITCSGLDSYHKTVRLDRLSYAKPDKVLTSINTN
ncbi:flavin reductase [Flavobacterium sp.]|uniref:flavin reductase family protein n=1 Tax=Flavobacterium sp. TaxID=239 RepID=UPI0025CE4740|nr:flavin reductase [Flavobacterium sp.]